MSTYFLYKICLIDHRWEGLKTLSEYASYVFERDISDAKNFNIKYSKDLDIFYEVDTFLNTVKKILNFAAEEGHWEGYFDTEVRVFNVPVENSFDYGFVWKQENNGDTFVASPQPMSHLEQHCYYEKSPKVVVT